MKVDELETMLRDTLADGRLSRGERRALAGRLADESADNHALQRYRRAALDVAREHTRDPRDGELLTWLYEVLSLMTPEPLEAAYNEALFSPGDRCLRRIRGLIRAAQRTLDVCVYTITDDRIAGVLLDAHRRGVAVRVLSDAMKTLDAGSDIGRLGEAGVAVALDTPDKYMHHKFALFDGRVLATGSYNWTRSAAEANDENLIVTAEPRLVQAFHDEFESLWTRYARADVAPARRKE